jgi:hypothetical protein
LTSGHSTRPLGIRVAIASLAPWKKGSRFMRFKMGVLGIFVASLMTGCAGPEDETTGSGDQHVEEAKPSQAATPTGPPASWDGVWSAHFDGGKTVGGSAILVGYVVTVHGDDVTVSADGFQTMRRVNGKGKATGNDLVVTFDSCGEGDQFQCGGLKEGDTLLRLQRASSKVTLSFDKLTLEGNKLTTERTSSGLWQGSWAAVFSGGHTVGGTGIVVSYSILVGETTVTVSADGFQTMRRIEAVGKAEGNDLVVTFDRCGDGDQFMCASFERGDAVVRLHRDGDRSSVVFDKLGAETKTLPLSLHL